MKRLGIVAGVVIAVMVCLYVGLAYLSMLAGVGAGAFFFVLGQGAHVDGPPRFDRSSRIGASLCAAGLAAAAIGHQPPYPDGFRLFYWFCLAVGCAAALGLAAPTRA